MHYYKNLQNWMNDSILSRLANCLTKLIDEKFNTTRWGDLSIWLECLDKLPNVVGDPVALDSGVCIGNANQLAIPQDLSHIHI